MVWRAALVLVVTCCLCSAQIATADGREGGSGYKALNNLISVAIKNIYYDGQFKSIYSLASTSRVLPVGTCARELYGAKSYDGGVVGSIIERGTIRIGVTSLVVGPTYFNKDVNPPTGFFADLGLILANELSFLLRANIVPEYVVIPTTSFFTDITNALNKGTVDTVIGTSWLKSRTRAVDFSCWYEAPSPQGIFRAPSRGRALPAGFTIPSNIAGWNNPAITVATLAGSIFEDAVNQYLPQAQKVYFPKLNNMYDAIGLPGAAGADIGVAIIGEVQSYNAENGGVLVLQDGTTTTAGGANAFTTKKA